MRILTIAVLLAVFPVAPALAQSKPPTGKPAAKAQAKAQPSATRKAQNGSRTNPCAEYGAGFVQVAGSGTCVKIGGYVRMQGSVR